MHVTRLSLKLSTRLLAWSWFLESTKLLIRDKSSSATFTHREKLSSKTCWLVAKDLKDYESCKTRHGNGVDTDCFTASNWWHFVADIYRCLTDYFTICSSYFLNLNFAEYFHYLALVSTVVRVNYSCHLTSMKLWKYFKIFTICILLSFEGEKKYFKIH